MRDWNSFGTARSIMKFLDADVKRHFASVSAMNTNWPEYSNEQGERRVCGAVGRTSGLESDETGKVR